MRRTKHITLRESMLSIIDATPTNEVPHRVEWLISKSCEEGATTDSYMLCCVDGQRFILNLNNGFMYNWYTNQFGTNAWINRPFITHYELTQFFKNVYKELIA